MFREISEDLHTKVRKFERRRRNKIPFKITDLIPTYNQGPGVNEKEI